MSKTSRLTDQELGVVEQFAKAIVDQVKAQRIVVEDTVPYKVEGPISDYMYHIKKGQVNGICGFIMYFKHRVQKGMGRDKYFEWEKKPSHFFPNSFDVANTLVMTLRQFGGPRASTT